LANVRYIEKSFYGDVSQMIIVPPSGGEDFRNTLVPDGAIIAIHEPLGGQRLDPLVVPDVLRTWPILEGGYDFLQEASAEGRLDLSLVLTSHSDYGDLRRSGIDLRAEAARMQTMGGLLLPEVVHHSVRSGLDTRACNDVAQGRLTAEEALERVGEPQATFMHEVFEAIHGSEAQIALPDYRLGHDVKDADVLAPLHILTEQWHNASEAIESRPGESLGLLTGFQLFREFFVVGLTGVVMSRLRHARVPGPYAGTLVMGSAHPGVAKKIDALTGIQTRIVGHESDDPTNKILLRCMGRAALTGEDILDLYLG
jgi:hypothetical protein